MTRRPCEPSSSASVSAKLSPTQLNSLCPEVFSNGSIITTSLTACGARAAARGCAAAKSARSARTVAAKRLNIKTTSAKN